MCPLNCHVGIFEVLEDDMDRNKAVGLIKDALHRIEHPSQNAKGMPEQTGGAYWRLAQVLEKYLAPRLDEMEGKEHANHIRETHGVIHRNNAA